MSDAPRLVHRILSSGEHCISSPDVKGLSAVAQTEAEARHNAAALLAEFQRLGLPIRPRTTAMKHEAA